MNININNNNNNNNTQTTNIIKISARKRSTVKTTRALIYPITKTSLFKYIENFTTKKLKIFR